MNDIEEKIPLVEGTASDMNTVTNSYSFVKILAVVAISLISLAVVQNIVFTTSPRKNSMSLISSSTTVKRTSGKQPIVAGCINIYGSDYRTYPNTDALVLCETAQLLTDQIDDFGFAPWDRNHGISFVETVIITDSE